MQPGAIFATSIIAVASAASSSTTSPAAATPTGTHPAPVATGNPDVTYVAKFDDSNVSGDISFSAGKGGKGAEVKVDLKGFKGVPGPYAYHVHVDPIPADGNCTGTLGHLDPYGVVASNACTSKDQQNCQVGDLSGKHGTIPYNNGDTVSYSNSYEDLYLSLVKGDKSFVGNRSIVIHRKDDTRLACANITLSEVTTSSTGNSTTNATVSATASPSPTSGASLFGASSMLAIGALVAGLVMAL